MEELKLPSNKTLLPFQVGAIEGMLTFLNTKGDVYNACEPGLGKTVQSIVAANTLFFDKPNYSILVLCPSILKFVWENEIMSWCLRAHVHEVTLSILNSAKDRIYLLDSNTAPRHWMICSYGLLTDESLLRTLSSKYWDLLILDEAHYLKNPKAKRTKAVLNHIWPKSIKHIALSGTPFLNNVSDGFTLFNKFAPNHFPDFWHFVQTYTNARKGPFGWEFKGVKNVDRLRKIMRENFYIRYTKDEVLSDLPDKRFERIPLPAKYAVKYTKEELAAKENYLKLLKEHIIEGNKGLPPPPPVSVMKKRHEQGLLKVPPIVEFAEELLEQEIPIVLFGIHVDVLKAYHTHLIKYKPSFIIGETASKERENQVNRFQNGDTNIFIGNLTAAGVGITLTRSSTVLLAELSYSPGEIAQACDRVHRIGQKNAVQIFTFPVEGSEIDNDITEIVMNKVKVFSEVLG